MPPLRGATPFGSGRDAGRLVNGVARSGMAAVAAAALSGGAAVALTGGGGDGSASAGAPLWDPAAAFEVAGRPAPAALARRGDRATLWNRGSALASVETTSGCAERRPRRFRLRLPLADPGRLQGPLSVTLRLSMERSAGWVQGEALARTAGGETVDAFVDVGAGQQYLTVFAPAADVRARGGLEVEGILLACSRRGGSGRLRLETIEVAS